MTIPGYDPEDLDDALRTRLEESDPADVLSEEELRAYEAGEDLVDALEVETIRRLLRGSKS